MIKVTDIGGTVKYLNADLIERIEVVPDTIIVLVNGHSYIVRDSARELVERVRRFKSRVSPPVRHSALPAAGGPAAKFRRGHYR